LGSTQVYYYYIAKAVAAVHLIIIFLNLVSVPLLIAYEPFYVWMPLITFLVSPLVGGTYCMFNRLENYYRAKAGMPLINDRIGALFGDFKED
jgi:hypothetical protein